MKTLTILASFAVLSTAALAAPPSSNPHPDESVGVLPEYVVTARKIVGNESVGVLPEYVVTARKVAGDESVGVLPEYVVKGRRSSDPAPATLSSPKASGATGTRKAATPPRPPVVGQL